MIEVPQMPDSLKPLKILSSSIFWVRLSTYDDDGTIVVVVKRSAIEDRLQVKTATDLERESIIRANMDVLQNIVDSRASRREWSVASGSAGPIRQIFIRENDLRDCDFHLPRR